MEFWEIRVWSETAVFQFTGLTRSVFQERDTASLQKQTGYLEEDSFPSFIMGIVAELLITPCMFR